MCSKVEQLEPQLQLCSSISGLVVEYIVAIDVTQVRFLADASWAIGNWHRKARPTAHGIFMTAAFKINLLGDHVRNFAQA